MNTLPAEILHQIFIQLPIVQKQECTFVCTHWAEIILSRSMFHTIKIHSSGTKLFKKFIEMIERDPSRGAQVEHLELLFCIDEYHNTKRLLRLFPNLKVLNMVGEGYSLQRQETSIISQPFEFNDNRPVLEVLGDCNESGVTHVLLQSNLCSRITSLNLFMNGYGDSSYLYPLMHNLPVLKTLTMWRALMSWQDLETLHRNIPSLEALELDRINFPKDDILPLNVMPAINMKKIAVNLSTLETAMGVYLPRYIQAKYPNMECLNFWIDLCPDFDNFIQFNRVSFQSLLQHYGSQLKSIEGLDLTDNADVIKRLDEYGCKPNTLHLKSEEEEEGTVLIDLTESKLGAYVENLRLEMPVTSYKWLKKANNLKKLSIDQNHFHDHPEFDNEEYYKYTREMAIDLSKFSRLSSKTCESLLIDYCWVMFDSSDADDSETSKQICSIKELNMNYVTIFSSAFSTYISNCLPFLHSLTLIEVTYSDSILDLPNHHFTFVKIKKYDFYNTKLALITNDNKEPFHYDIKKAQSYKECRKLDLNPQLLPVSPEEFADKWFITFKCGSVKKFILNEYQLFLATDESMNKSNTFE